MKFSAALLAVLLLLGFTSTASAQEAESQEPVGSVWSSEQQELIQQVEPGTIQPMQVGLSGTAEAIVGMTWYGTSFLNWNIVGTAISKIIAGDNTYNVCAQVVDVRRNGASRGGTERNCGEIGVGGSVQQDKRVIEDWHGATWRTETYHEFARTGSYWAPVLSVDQNL